jgi:hypothetical protein
MKVFVTGKIVPRKKVHRSLDNFPITEVISDASVGVPLLAEEWAMFNSVKIRRYHPNTRKWGKNANAMMYKNIVRNVDKVIVVCESEEDGVEMVTKLPKGANVQVVRV